LFEPGAARLVSVRAAIAVPTVNAGRSATVRAGGRNYTVH
jgi:hypothetical protein